MTYGDRHSNKEMNDGWMSSNQLNTESQATENNISPVLLCEAIRLMTVRDIVSGPVFLSRVSTLTRDID